MLEYLHLILDAHSCSCEVETQCSGSTKGLLLEIHGGNSKFSELDSRGFFAQQ